MTRKEFYETIKTVSIDDEIVNKISKVYNCLVPDEIKRIVSYSSVPVLFDENESRTLSLNEILNAEKDYSVTFESQNIIPIIELGCDDYIVYDGNKNIWCLYNILDEVLFGENSSFEEIFFKY